MASQKQQELIDVLKSRKIDAHFNGRFLNGSTTIKKANGKRQRQSFGLMFDDPETLDGPKVTESLRGTYAEAFARDAFFESLRIGQGEETALHFVLECKRDGARSGMTPEFAERHCEAISAVEAE